MKETRPLKMPMSRAKGTPIIESEMAQNTAIKVMAASCPINHRCTVWYIALQSTSRVLWPPPGGKERDEPVHPGLGPDDQVDGGDEHDEPQRERRGERQAYPGRRGDRAPGQDLPPDVGQALPAQADLGAEPEKALDPVEQVHGLRPAASGTPPRAARDCVSTTGTTARPKSQSAAASAATTARTPHVRGSPRR